MSVLTSMPALGPFNSGNVLQSQRSAKINHQKWASKWLSAHKKTPKEADFRRKPPIKSTKSRKTNLRRQSRYSLKQYVQQEIEAVTSIYDKTYYPLQKKKSSHKSTKTTKPKPKSKELTKVPPVPIPVRVAFLGESTKLNLQFTGNIVCNVDYRFTLSLSTLRSFAPDIFLGRTVHIMFTKNDIPLQGQLTCISHLGFIRMQNVEPLRTYRYGTMDRNDYWFHYKAISRVLLYDEGLRRYEDVTAVMMDLLKFKVVHWLRGGDAVENGYTLDDIQKCARRCGFKTEDLHETCQCTEDTQYTMCSALRAVGRRFRDEQSKVNCHELLQRKTHYLLVKGMRFETDELHLILRSFARIGGRLSDRSRSPKKKGMQFVGWDEEEVVRMSKKLCRRRC